MLGDFSELVSLSHSHQLADNRCLRRPIAAQHLHSYGGTVDERAIRFLAKYCANEWWFFYVLEQASRHAIGPVIQLAHVVEAIIRLRRLIPTCLVDGDVEKLDRDQLAVAIATGTVVLDSVTSCPPTYCINPLFNCRFDPVQAAVEFSGFKAA